MYQFNGLDVTGEEDPISIYMPHWDLEIGSVYLPVFEKQHLQTLMARLSS